MSGHGTAYREALLDHYRNPRNKADPGDAQVVRRGRNPRCGDDIEIGVDFAGDTVERVRFHGRGCSICIASASIMTRAVARKTRGQAAELAGYVRDWLGAVTDADTGIDTPAPEWLAPLSPIRDMPARHRCVLLAWDALTAAVTAPDADGRAR